MKSVLAILGIAVVAILFSVLATPHSKELTENVQDRDEARKNPPTAATPNKNPAAAATPAEPFNPPREGAVTVAMSVAVSPERPLGHSAIAVM